MYTSKRPLAWLLAALTLMIFSTALACPAYPGEVTFTDANGEEFQARLFGDEFFSYTTDIEGNLLVVDGGGAWRYVVAQNGEFAVGEPLHPAFYSAAPNGSSGDEAPKVNMNDVDASQIKDKISAVRDSAALVGGAFLSGLPANGAPANGVASTRTDIPSNYDCNTNSQDALCGKYATLSNSFTIPKIGATCPLLVIRLNYADIECKSTAAQWSNRIFNDGVSKYYTEVSNGKFTYVPATETNGEQDGVVSVTLPIDMPRYGSTFSGLYTNASGTNYTMYNKSMVFAYAVSAAAAYVDFNSFDRNNDKIITPHELAMVVVSAGYEASAMGPDGAEGKKATWAHSWLVNDGHYVRTVKVDDVVVYKYTTLGENFNPKYDYQSPTDTSYKQMQFGTVCHELGHDLGLKDLYDTGYSNLRYRVDGLSLMASGCWGRADNTAQPGSLPTHIDAYQKTWLGFYDETPIGTGRHSLYQAASPSDYNVLRLGSGKVYYLIENRQLEGFDKGLVPFYGTGADCGGIVIWRIDENAIDKYWYYNTVNNHEGEYGAMPVFIEPGDGTKTPFWNSVTSRRAQYCTASPYRVFSTDISSAAMNILVDYLPASGAITYTYENWLADNAYDTMAPPSGLQPDVPSDPEDLFGTNAASGAAAPATPSDMSATGTDASVFTAGETPPQTADNGSIMGFLLLLAAYLGLIIFRRKA